MMSYTAEQESEFKRLFAARRKRQAMVAIPFIAALLVIVMGRGGERMDLLGVSAVIWGPVLAVFVVGALVFSFKNWRCPACNGYLGKAFNPRYCSKCGVELR
jgi:hypothetical protein